MVLSDRSLKKALLHTKHIKVRNSPPKNEWKSKDLPSRKEEAHSQRFPPALRQLLAQWLLKPRWVTGPEQQMVNF